MKTNLLMLILSRMLVNLAYHYRSLHIAHSVGISLYEIHVGPSRIAIFANIFMNKHWW